MNVSLRNHEYDFVKSCSPMSTGFCSFCSIANIRLHVTSSFSCKLLILLPKDNPTMVTTLLVPPPNPAHSGRIDLWRDIQNEATLAYILCRIAAPSCP